MCSLTWVNTFPKTLWAHNQYDVTVALSFVLWMVWRSFKQPMMDGTFGTGTSTLIIWLVDHGD